MAQRRVGIQTVAQRARVSIATVSRVMSGSSSVNPQMAARVREAAAELGYRPNGAARGLASGLQRSIGTLVPDITNPYFSNVMQAVSHEAETHGFRLVIADTDRQADRELDACLGLAAQSDALLLIAPRMPVEDLKELPRRAPATVIVNRIELGVDLPMVAVDNFSAMLELCHHLVQLGHRKAVYLAGPDSSWQNRERWRGVTQARMLGLEATRVQTPGTLESGYQMLDEAVRGGPTALIAFNDLVAIGAMSALRARGITVPAQLSITGFDDIEAARYAEPRLTTATSPMPLLGKEAWRLLWATLHGEHPDNPGLLPAAVVHGGSTGPAPL